MNKSNIESIWVDGVPSKINKEDLLSMEDLLKICIKYTVEHILLPKGYKVLTVKDKANEYPNIITVKGDKKYSVIVVPNLFPKFISIKDDFRITFVNQCQNDNTIPVFCPVIILSKDKERATKSVYLKGDIFNVNSVGQIILTNQISQKITPNTLNFKF